MCEAHAFVLRDEREVKVLDSVDELEVAGEEIRLINIFGEQKISESQSERVQRVRKENPAGTSAVTLLFAR